MEDPNSPVTVVPPLCCGRSRSGHQRRPGPVYGTRERVFQMPIIGKYQPASIDDSALDPDARLLSSDDRTTHHDGLPCCSYGDQPSPRRPGDGTTDLADLADPGRTNLRIMEDPNSPVTVAPPLCCGRSRSGLQRRPGPVYGSRERVFQMPITGMYSCSSAQPTLPDALQPSSSYESSATHSRQSLSGSPSHQQCHLYYQNAGGMNGNLGDYLHASSGECYDFIALTETWLKDHTLSSQIFGAEYEVFRCNRGPDNSRKTEGGGVLIAARRCFKPRLIFKDAWKAVEQVWVSLKLSDRVLFLCVVYFPPDRTYDKDLYKIHLDSLASVTEQTRPMDDIIVVGDFNLPNLTWTPSRNGFLYPDPDRSRFHSCANDLLAGYNVATLQQVNHVENEDGRRLDLCFVSAQDFAPTLIVAPVPLAKVVRRHPAIVITVDGTHSSPARDRPDSVSYNFRGADYEGMSLALRNIDWEDMLDFDDVDNAVNTFSAVLRDHIDQFVPKVRKRTWNHLPWQTPELRNLKTQKRAAFKVFSRCGSLPLRDYYLRINSRYQRLSRSCFANYQRRKQYELKSNPKKFWKFVEENRKESGLPTSLHLADEEAESPEEICQLFAKKFASVFTNEPITEDEIQTAADNVPRCDRSLASIDIDEDAISAAITKLKHSSSPGPDGIPATLLKRCSSVLLAPLLHLFRLSLASGTFPWTWKQAFLFPVHKKGDRRNVENYRGISALCAASKLFELVVIDPIFAHCRQELSSDQHGFLPNRSTATNLLCFTEFVFDSFDNRSQTDAIYTDLSAAFDKINHRIAIAKLERLGFRGSLLVWFRSYLTGRSLRVKIEDALSDTIDATSGIAQGSHIGPIVFLFYFDDANYTLEGPRLAYADDLKLFARIDCLGDAEVLQRELDKFAGWCDVNRMVLNPGKCQAITFSRKHVPIPYDYHLGDTVVQRVDHVKDLGVILDAKLDFKQHISFITAKASRQLGLVIRMTRHFTDIQCLKTLFCSLVRSSLEYCSTVWTPHYNNAVYQLERIQRRFVRYALRLLPWRQPQQLPPYEDRCQLMHLDSLQLRRDLARALTVSDVLTGKIDCPALRDKIRLEAPARQLRHTPVMQIPFRRTNYSANGAIVGLKRAFNKVSNVFDVSLSRNVLKSKFLSVLRRVF